MKNYFNAREFSQHLVLMAAQQTAKDFEESTALLPEERTYLKYIVTYSDKLTNSIIKRIGEPYKRRVVGTLKSNDLRLVGKYSAFKEAVSFSDTEDLEPAVKELQMLNCLDCKYDDYKKCPIWAICQSVGVEGTTESGCPYGTKDLFDEE